MECFFLFRNCGECFRVYGGDIGVKICLDFPFYVEYVNEFQMFPVYLGDRKIDFLLFSILILIILILSKTVKNVNFNSGHSAYQHFSYKIYQTTLFRFFFV